MLDALKAIFSWLSEGSNATNILLTGATCLTLVVYLLQCKNQRRAAAIEIKEQILEIEDKIKDLMKMKGKFKGSDLYGLGPILTENLWKKNRAILNKYLSEEDRRLLGDFYSLAEKLERARADWVNQMINTWDSKTLLVQLKSLDFHFETSNLEQQNLFNDLINRYILNEFVFEPMVCLEILRDTEGFRLLEGTTTYLKLCKLSKRLFEKIGWR